MVDEKDGGTTAGADAGDKKGVLESATDKVRQHKEDAVPFKVLTEENPSGVRRKIQVEVDQAEWDKRLADLFKNVRQQASLPGFRKGKAPIHLLKARYQQGAVNELVEKISPLIIRDYEKDKELTIYGTPSITDYTADEGKPVTITLEMEIKPEIKPENYTGLELEVPERKLPADAREKEIEALREKNVTYNTVERAFTAEDAVELDYKITDKEGKTLQHRSGQLIERAAEAMPKELLDELVGKSVGDRVDVEVNDIKYSMTIKAVQERKLPEVNDDFAKDLGYADVAELEKVLDEKLASAVKEANDDEAFELLVAKLVENHDFEIPQALKQHVLKEMADTDLNYYRSTGMAPPRLQGLEGADDYGASLNTDAEQRVKGFLLIDAIGKKENLIAEEADLNKELEKRAEEQGRKPVGVRANLERHRQWDQFVEQVRFNRIREFLLGSAKIKYVEPKEETAEAGADADSEPAKEKPAPKKKAPAKKKEAAETEAAE